jgi:hypothetical protein
MEVERSSSRLPDPASARAGPPAFCRDLVMFREKRAGAHGMIRNKTATPRRFQRWTKGNGGDRLNHPR